MSNIPSRYLKGVDKEERIKELKRRQKSNQPLKDLYPKKTDKEAIKKGIVKKSKYTIKFNKLYPDIKFDKGVFSKKFKIPLKVLNEVYDKGIKAWKTSGSRPGANAIAWARARLYKFILIELGHMPKLKNDPDNSIHRKV